MADSKGVYFMEFTGWLTDLGVYRIGMKVVAERYGENAVKKGDMLGSFVDSGLSRKEAEGESMVMM